MIASFTSHSGDAVYFIDPLSCASNVFYSPLAVAAPKKKKRKKRKKAKKKPLCFCRVLEP